MQENDARFTAGSELSGFPGATHGRRDAAHGNLTIVGLLNVILRRRGLVLLCATIPALLLAVPRFFTSRVYTATAAFTPRSRSAATPSLSGLAAQLGVAVPTGDQTNSPAFVERLLRSRQILGRVVAARYPLPGAPTRTGTLAEIYSIERSDSLTRRDAAIEQLRRNSRTDVDAKSGVLTLHVTSLTPALSAALGNRMIEEVNRFSLESRQSQASTERQFAEQQLGAARAALQQAEDRLRDFEQRNRSYDLSADLRLERERLQRSVIFRQQLYTSLSQNYEQARLDEARDTPSLLVLEPAEQPVHPDPRGVVKGAVLGFLGGVLLGVLLAFGREYFANMARDESSDIAEFASLRGSVIDDVLHPWRPIARRLRPTRGS